MTISQRLAIPQFTLVEWRVLSRNDSFVTGTTDIISQANRNIPQFIDINLAFLRVGSYHPVGSR